MASKQVADIVRKKQRNLKRLKTEEKWIRKFCMQMRNAAGVSIEIYTHPGIDPKDIELMLKFRKPTVGEVLVGLDSIPTQNSL